MFWMDKSKVQADEIPAPEGLPPDVIISPDTRRAGRIPPGQSRTKKWPGLDASGPPVLVAPKPNNRPVNQLRQLLRRNLIPTLKRGVRPVMRQQNQSAFVSVRIHGGLQPGEQGVGNSAPRLERRRLAKPFAPLQHRQFPPFKTGRIVACVQSNDAPVLIFKAKEARPLSRS